MCGHVGIAGDLKYADEALIKRLMIFNYLRGPDATGLATVRKHGENKVAKTNSHPINLFEMQRFKDAIPATGSQAYIAHSRAATRGDKSEVNSHPFAYGDIVGAHNGTLDYESVKRLEDALGERFSVDSMALIAAIDKLGIEVAIELCTEGKTTDSGAWSLVWADKKDETLNFLRNKHRPMWFAFDKDVKRLIWSSAYEFIDCALRTGPGGYDMYVEGEKKNQYFATKIDTLYSFKLDELKEGATVRPWPEVKEIKGREPVTVAASTNSQYPFGNGPTTTGPKIGFHSHQHRQTDDGKKTKETQFGESIIHLIGSKDSPLAGYIDEAAFNSMAQYGCTFCKKDVEYEQAGLTIYERDNAILCPTCSGHSLAEEVFDLPPTRIYALAARLQEIL